MNVAIIEDESVTALFLESTLENLGHHVFDSFDNADDLYNALKENDAIDIILMDINIKGRTDGITLAKTLKREYPGISIIFITSYQDSETINEAKGAEPVGYLIKPVLQSNIEAVMMVAEAHRQKEYLDQNDKDEVTIGDYTYHSQSKLMYYDGRSIELSFNETQCIEALINSMNSYLSSEQLIGIIWNGEKDVTSLRELIFRLRKKLPGLTIKNIPNLGYFITTD